jgi:hypothetical protein
MATFVSSLNTYQFAWNGFLFGTGTNGITVTNVDGLMSLPDIRNQDDLRGYTDGQYSGRDFYNGRTVTIDMLITGDSSHSAQYYFNQMQANMYPQQLGTPSQLGAFQFELNTTAGLKVMYGRVRTIETSVDPDFTFGYIQTAVEFFFPDPRYYDYPYTTSSTSSSLTLSNNGWAISCPVITISSPSANTTFWIVNGTTSSAPYMQFVTGPSTSAIVIDLLQRTITQGGVPARNLLLGMNGGWLAMPPITSSYVLNTYTGSIGGSSGPSMSVSYTDAYV